jgi:transposase
MIRIRFTEAEKQELNFQRYQHPHPHVQRKMETLWLKSHGLAHQEIAALTGISKNTVTTYLKEYQIGGIDKLKEIRFYRPQSELVNHTQTIEAEFRSHPPATIAEAANTIEQLTGIRRSEPQVRQFLSTIGLKRTKVGMIPAKADFQEQEDFKKKS